LDIQKVREELRVRQHVSAGHSGKSVTSGRETAPSPGSSFPAAVLLFLVGMELAYPLPKGKELVGAFGIVFRDVFDKFPEISD
jgi:hypothetical protein